MPTFIQHLRNTFLYNWADCIIGRSLVYQTNTFSIVLVVMILLLMRKTRKHQQLDVAYFDSMRLLQHLYNLSARIESIYLLTLFIIIKRGNTKPADNINRPLYFYFFPQVTFDHLSARSHVCGIATVVCCYDKQQVCGLIFWTNPLLCVQLIVPFKEMVRTVLVSVVSNVYKIV